MKVNVKPALAVKDGTPFPIRFELKELNYLKLCGNDKQALYSVYDPKTDKLYGFAKVSADTDTMQQVKLSEVNFKELQ